MKYIKEFRERFSKQPVFSIRDVKTYLGGKKISRQYIYTLLNHLTKRKEINRITRGIYSFNTDPNVLSFAFNPSYHGLQDALSIHNLWEQETNPIIITPRKIRSGIRNILETNAIIRRLDRKMFFGFDSVKYFDWWIPVSDIEKTLIDFAYFKEPLDSETLKEIIEKIDAKKLEKYLKRVPKRTRKKVLEFLSKQ